MELPGNESLCFINKLEDIKLSIDDFNNAITEAVRSAAITCGMSRKIHITEPNFRDKPWYDLECRRSRLRVLQTLKELRNNHFGEYYRNKYHATRKTHSNLLKSKRKRHIDWIKFCMRHPKSTTSFWRTFNHFKSRSLNLNAIPLTTWEKFYADIMPHRFVTEHIFFIKTDEFLDSEITLNDLQTAIKALKNNKSPGIDGLQNEFWKNGSDELNASLLNLFNTVATTGFTPRAWSEIELFMLHKKGDSDQPGNYRGIALINTITKLFTRILYSR
ncbi:unnamed protein product, partial [Allacma fusca]